MRLRATKSCGSFECVLEGSFELLVHIEADPNIQFYAEFNFDTVLRSWEAERLVDIPAYTVSHRAGMFVIAAWPSRPLECSIFRRVWAELDVTLAKRGMWLLTTTPEELRREPRWSQALELARCASAAMSPGDRERVMTHLTEVGRSTIRNCMRLCWASPDSRDAVLQLVASGIAFLDQPDDISLGSTISLHPPQCKQPSWLGAPLPRQLSTYYAAEARRW